LSRPVLYNIKIKLEYTNNTFNWVGTPDSLETDRLQTTL